MKIEQLSDREYKLIIEHGDDCYTEQDELEFSKPYMNPAYFLHCILRSTKGFEIIQSITPLVLRKWFIESETLWDQFHAKFSQLP